MKQLDIPIIQRIYELYKLLHTLRRIIPKGDRYALWLRCENESLDLLEAFLTAGHATPAERLPMLKETSGKLDKLKILIRLSHDLRLLDQKKYIQVQTILDEIGRMLGGWLKSLKKE